MLFKIDFKYQAIKWFFIIHAACVTILNYQSFILLNESEIDLSSSSKRYNE